MFRKLLALLLATTPTAAAAAAAAAAHGSLTGTIVPRCQDILIPVNVSALNRDLSSIASLKSLNDPAAVNKIIASAGTVVSSGVYTIAARYCYPIANIKTRQKTLQILVHGITYTRDYWSGLAPPGSGTKPGQDQYSWLLYAANEGYPTLSVDRLCNGASSKPNGLLVCQLPLQSEVMHAIVQAARNGTIPGVQTSFEKIIYVGHSYGSLIANHLSIQHPSDVDSYIMSGYSAKLAQGSPGILVLPSYQPAAAVAEPSKFGGLLLDPAYIMATSVNGSRTEFYRGNYDEQVFQYDHHNRGTVTIGEFATALLGQAPAPDFKGSILVLDGNNDGVFCQDGPAQALSGVPGNCSKGFSSGVRQNYPAASHFAFHNTGNTGHCLNLHRTAQESFKVAHQFLTSVGL